MHVQHDACNVIDGSACQRSQRYSLTEMITACVIGLRAGLLGVRFVCLRVLIHA